MPVKQLIIATAVLAAFGSAPGKAAPPEPSAATTRLVQQVTELFFDQLPRHEFDVEYGFASQLFYAQTTAADWQRLRQAFVDMVDRTPRYRPHAMTYYERDRLYAAIDFSGSVDAGTDICGYVIWELPDETTIGFVRLEQNIVDHEVIGQMAPDEAVGLLQGWHCPGDLIGDILGLSR